MGREGLFLLGEQIYTKLGKSGLGITLRSHRSVGGSSQLLYRLSVSNATALLSRAT
jgi:hypothetical protein